MEDPVGWKVYLLAAPGVLLLVGLAAGVVWTRFRPK